MNDAWGNGWTLGECVDATQVDGNTDGYHRAKGKGSVRCVREVREVHALSLTLTHLKYWLTHFCNNLKPDGSEAESPMVSWAPRFVEWSALVEIRAFSCVNCYWIYHVSHCTQCARAFQRS